MRKYNSKKEFIKKYSIPVFGIPTAFITGNLVFIVDNKEILKYFLTWEYLFQIIFFVVFMGIMAGYLWGNMMWRKFENDNLEE
jgi:uncharacterized membrane protein YoaK (UPF0700 family)